MQARGICGVFIGGASRRMEGFPKALLRDARGETVLSRTLRAARAAGLEPVLVGAWPIATDLRVIADAAPNAGPLAGLVALLSEVERACVVACDMPALTGAALYALSQADDAPIVAARRDGRWEPFFARYDHRMLPLARVRLAAGQLSLQGLLDAAGAAPFELDACILQDVDTPQDAAQAGLS